MRGVGDYRGGVPCLLWVYFLQGCNHGNLLLLLLCGVLAAPGGGSPDGGLTWYRNCSATHDVVLHGMEGIIETPMPGVFPSNCGGPLSPGICCRWVIAVADPRLWVQISVLDSTLPIKRSGRCYRDSEVTVLDADSRRVEAVCGPVGSARTIVVKTPGAMIGFRGLIKVRAMATLHYKVIGCEPIPEVVEKQTGVVSVRTTAFSANVTCTSGDVRHFQCVGRTWHPSPQDLSCPYVPQSSTVPAHRDRPGDDTTPPINQLPVTTQSHLLPPWGATSNDTVTSILKAGSTGTGQEYHGMDKILLSLLILGSVTGVLLTLIVILVILRHIRHRKSRSSNNAHQRPALLAASISPPTPIIERPYVDTYEELDPRGNTRQFSPRLRLESEPVVRPLQLPVPGEGDNDLFPPPFDEGMPLRVGGMTSEGPVEDEYAVLRGGGSVERSLSLTEEMENSLRQMEASYAVPDMKAKRYSGVKIVENDIYGT